MKTRMNVGISSLILIFIVLCLVTFGLLSMSSARNDLTMAERNGDSVKEYYRADGEGERFIAMIDGKLKSAADPEAQGPQDILESSMEQALKELGDFYDEEQQVIHTDIPMERGQALRVELDPGIEGEKGAWCRILSFYVYNQEDYEIDQSMPVWTGQ